DAAADAEELRGLLVAQAGEVAERHQPGGLRVVLLQLAEGLVEGERLVVLPVGGGGLVVPGDAPGRAPALLGPGAAGRGPGGAVRGRRRPRRRKGRGRPSAARRRRPAAGTPRGPGRWAGANVRGPRGPASAPPVGAARRRPAATAGRRRAGHLARWRTEF